ncbi:MAG: thiamine biosynthesis protein ThiF [Rhodospirillaceae bacterium]|jgi:sulfur-carrier protein adenylyltransferase/sulfurtransferase|nr:thiamine biosynthesis protein ThiF [Rhodospirillaceae bacterium]MBT5459528.1 thiamine biosynthesis protein ThiF [Rhodospirillaceae bacterium]
MTISFDRHEAFSRNIGWITELEQEQLWAKRVAIAGLGGVGGAHVLTLARLGIGHFHLADLDQFELANFNRQVGASMSTLGRNKTDVMAEMARDINPEIDLKLFSGGVNDDNIDAFLDGVDLYVDGLDFFVLDVRCAVFRRCHERGIPVVTAAPIGLGTGYLIFMPDGMSFDDYFRLDGHSVDRQYVDFLVGLVPKAYHRPYLIDPSRTNLSGRRAPSTVSAIQLCTGVIAAEAVKILTGRGRVYAAPWFHQFDAFRSKWTRGKLRWGNRGPLQTLKRQIGYRVFSQMAAKARPIEQTDAEIGGDMDRILLHARWAPSGDNTQPWRFEITGEESLTVHLTSKDDDVYDYNDGQPTLLSAGMLLETLRISANELGRTLRWRYAGGAGRSHRIDVEVPRSPDVVSDPLFSYLEIRSVDRRPYGLTPLTDDVKQQLETALGDTLDMEWHIDLPDRLRESRLNMKSTALRLGLESAFKVHQRVIDWDNTFSRTGIPAGAVGLDNMTLKLMRGAMKSWSRMKFLNRYLFGSVQPRIQLDLIPGLFCAAHFTLRRRETAGRDISVQALLESGQAIQRFWLTLTKLGFAMQPALAPVIFAHYARCDAASDKNGGTSRLAMVLNKQISARSGGRPNSVLYRGRLGRPKVFPMMSRSIRLTLDDLTIQQLIEPGPLKGAETPSEGIRKTQAVG